MKSSNQKMPATDGKVNPIKGYGQDSSSSAIKYLPLLSLLIFISCHESTLEPFVTPPYRGINQNIILIQDRDDTLHNIGGSFRMGVWHSKRVYTVYPLKELTVDQNFRVVRDTILDLFGSYQFVSINHAGTNLLLVQSYFFGEVAGALFNYEIATGAFTKLRDSIFFVSSAIFTNDDQACVYYCYGNAGAGIQAGYYLYDLTKKTDTLLFTMSSSAGRHEVVNGFDLSPDGQKILFPIHSLTDPPLLAEYDLLSGTRDTLDVQFRFEFIWARYSPDGTSVAYSNYSWGSGGGIIYDLSDVGIMDRSSLKTHVLDVDTSPYVKEGSVSINIFPNWTYDSRNIIYGSALGPTFQGTISDYSLYLLTGVN